LNFYIETTDTENKSSKTIHTIQLSEVLIEINDESFIPILIKNIEKSEDSILHIYTINILASYQSEDAINQLVNEVLNKDNEAKIIEVCSAALSKSKGIVSLTVFTQLLDYENVRVRGNAVKGLGRFSSSEIKSLLLEHLNDENSFVQGEILKVLGDKGLLTNLLHINFNLYNAEALLHEIQKFKLKEMLPIVNWLKDKINNDDRLLVNIAYTFCILEETEKAKEIVNEFLSEDGIATSEFTLADLAKIAPSFDASYSLLIIEFVLKSIDKFEDKKRKGYWDDLCIEALEKIGDEKSIDMLKELATDYASQKELLEVERALRSINVLATNNDEDWYLHFINFNPTIGKIDLSRAIEGLGYIGSKKSIPIIRKIATLNKEDSYVCDTCFTSLGNIYRIRGVSKEITEMDLF
jgi:HEAT repeat protein